jgi:hypothetical protein
MKYKVQFRSPLSEFVRERSQSYINSRGTPVDDTRCRCTVTHLNGRAPATYSQCKGKQTDERPLRTYRSPTEEKSMPVCGRHASLYDRETEKHRAQEEKDKASNDLHRKAEQACKALRGHGIKARPHYAPERGSDLGRYDGGVVVVAASVDELLEAVQS